MSLFHELNSFQEFMEAIITEDIDGVALLQLTPKDIKNLGLIQLGPRKRLESYIERINKGEKDEQVERLQEMLKQLQGNLKDQAKTKTVRNYNKYTQSQEWITDVIFNYQYYQQ